jgi:SNF2 family DNA or RNA helicase
MPQITSSKALRSSTAMVRINKNLEALAAGRIVRPAPPSRIVKKPKIALRGGKPAVSTRPVEKPLPPVDVLRAKYKSFTAHTQIYDEAAKAYVMLGHILNSLDFCNGANTGLAGASDFLEWDKWEGEKLRSEFGDLSHSEHGTFMKITPEYVETVVDLSPIHITFGFSENEFAKQASRRAEAIVRSYFPGFKIPAKWKMQETEDSYSATKRKKPVIDMSEMVATFPLEKIGTVQPNYTSANTLTTAKKQQWEGPKYYTLPNKWGADPGSATVVEEDEETGKVRRKKNAVGTYNFRNVCFFRLTMKPEDGRIENSYRASEKGMDEGDMASLGQTNKVIIPIYVEVVMRWPTQFVLYATCSPTRKDMLPFLFYQYQAWHRAAYGGKRTKTGNMTVKVPSRVSHFGVTLERIAMEKAAGRIVKPRTNADDLCIIGSSEASLAGQVTWVPKGLNNIQEYLSVVKASYKPDSASFDFSGLTSIRDKGLFTDWYNAKFSYVRQTGIGLAGGADASGIQTYDLVGAIPLDYTTINRDLTMLLIADKNLLSNVVGLMRKFLSGELGAKPAFDYFSAAHLSTDPDLARNVKNLRGIDPTMGYLAQSGAMVEWKHLGGAPLHEAEPKEFTLERAICKLIGTIAQDMLDKFDDLTMSFESKVNYMRYRLVLICKYASQAKLYEDYAENKLKMNRLEGVNVKNKKTVVVANLPDLTTFLPPQVETANALSTNSEHALVDVEMGGGKCVQVQTIIPSSAGILKIGEIYQQVAHKLSNSQPGYKHLDTKIVHDGKQYKAEFAYRTHGKMLEITTSMGDEFAGLKGHKLWALQPDGSVDFKTLAKMNVGDWLPKQIGTNLFSRKTPKYMSLEAARILGFLVAEGHCATNLVSFHNSCNECLSLFNADWKTEFASDLRESYDKRSGCYGLHSNKEESDFLYRNLGLGQVTSAYKEVPVSVRMSPREYQIAFLQALFEGDGTIYKTNGNDYHHYVLEYDSISKELIRQVKYMLENLGIAGTVREHWKVATNTKKRRAVKSYCLRIDPNYFVKFEQDINFLSDRKKTMLAEATNHQQEIWQLDDERATNFETCGFFNQFPVAKFASSMLDRLEQLLTQHEFFTEQKRYRACSLNWFWRNALPDKNRYDAASINKRIRYTKSDVISRHYVNKLLAAVDSLPSEIKATVFADAKFTQCFAALNTSIKYIWTKIVSKIKRTVAEFAYDLSVPGPNAYAADGFFSHNTLTGTVEGSRALAQKLVKRVLYIVPNRLVTNWVDEINDKSHGQLNVFPITLRTIRRLQAILNPDEKNSSPRPDYTVLKKLIETSPPNTLFITTYHFLRADNEDIVYGNKEILRSYTAEFLRDLGFQLVICDESHNVKRLGTAQTAGASIVVSAAKYSRLMSGTIVNNNLTDLVGQGSMMNPAAFGTREQFCTKYTENGSAFSQLWKGTAERDVIEDSAPYFMRVTHKKQRWAFALPDLKEEFYKVDMTPKQQEFYNAKLQETLSNLTSSNPNLAKLLQDGNESAIERINAELARDESFQTLEAFIYAPDASPIFMQTEGLSPIDKISPKVPKVNEILTRHFDGFTDDNGTKVPPQPHKVIIFSSRKITSLHMFANLDKRFKRMAVHFSAGDENALNSFKQNDDVKILVADEGSINTGQNLQMANRLIRLETLWQPGDQDQGLARIWRPDFKNFKGRPNCYADWVYTDRSMEVAKIARLLSKMVSKKKYDRYLDDNFTKKPFVFDAKFFPEDAKQRFDEYIPKYKTGIPLQDILETPPLVSMNMESLQNFNDARQLRKYFAYYTLMNGYEDMEFAKSRAEGDQQLIDIIPEMRTKIDGSKTMAYQPRATGTDPSKIVQLKKYNFKPVSRIQSDMEVAAGKKLEAKRKDKYGPDYDDAEVEDTDKETYIEVNPVREGQLVNTEFGYGYVKKALTDDLNVNIPGLGMVKVPKAATWVIGNVKMLKEVQAQMKLAGKRGMVTVPDWVLKASKLKKPSLQEIRQQPGDDEDDVAEVKRKPTKLIDSDPNEDDNEKPEIRIDCAIIDGEIGLFCFAKGEESDKLQEEHGFTSFNPYYFVKVENSATLVKTLDFLNKKFEIAPALLRNFDPYIGLMRSKQIGVYEPSLFANTLRFLKIDSHKRVSGRVIRPFPIVLDGTLGIAIDHNRTEISPKVLPALKSAGIPGLIFKGLQEGVHVRLFHNKQQAIAVLSKLNEEYTNELGDSCMKFLSGLRSITPKKAPVKVEEDEAPVRRAAPKTTQLQTVKVKPGSVVRRAPPKAATTQPTPSRKPIVKKPIIRKPPPRR